MTGGGSILGERGVIGDLGEFLNFGDRRDSFVGFRRTIHNQGYSILYLMKAFAV